MTRRRQWVLLAMLAGCAAPVTHEPLWVRVEGTVRVVDDRVVRVVSILPGATRRWTEVTLTPDLNGTTQRFESEFGEYLRGNPRHRSVPVQVLDGKYLVFPFARQPLAAEVGAEVLICWDLWNNQGELSPRRQVDSCPDR